MLNEKPWEYDSKVIPLPWRSNEEQAVKSKLKSTGLTLGFYNFDGNVHPHPPVLRGVDMVVETMKKSGHKVLPWDPYNHTFAVDLINKIYVADGCAVSTLSL